MKRVPADRASAGRKGRGFRSPGRVVSSIAMLLAAAQVVAAAPASVMSLNVCTDQLAMLLAKPGQLISVSELAADPGLSFHASLAAGYKRNRGLAEEVLVSRPDVVVTGAYSLHNTTPLLKRLGYRIEEFEYSQTLDTIPREIRRMGEILGNEAKADRMADDFTAALGAIEAQRCSVAPTVIAYEQNGIALGAGSLVDSAMKAAGLRNIAAELGFEAMAPFPLELLVQHRPDIIVLPQPLADTPALADLVATHPAIAALGAETIRIHLPRGSMSCGGPFVIEAVRALAAAGRKVASCAAGEGVPR